MIETDFFILSQQQYEECNAEASELGLSVDYYLLEFCDVQGPKVTVN